jgi:hypothetical protein
VGSRSEAWEILVEVVACLFLQAFVVESQEALVAYQEAFPEASRLPCLALVEESQVYLPEVEIQARSFRLVLACSDPQQHSCS